MSQHHSAASEPIKREIATLGGGCFWCLEPVFLELRGVLEVVSGYSGGDAATANYRAVCSGSTRHAEVVQVIFDPEEVPFEDIVRVFFTIHDPTTPDRQGADTGPQYRSVIFYHSPEQQAGAEQVIGELVDLGVWDGPIVTELAPFEAFHPAEDYHQRYYEVNTQAPYCQIVINPKLAKFRRAFSSRLKGTRPLGVSESAPPGLS